MSTATPQTRARQLRIERIKFMQLRGAALSFPSFIKVTGCETRTNSYLENTPHGTVRVFVKSKVN